MTEQAQGVGHRDAVPESEPVPANIERRLRQAREHERAALTKALGEILRPHLARIAALERQLDQAGFKVDSEAYVERQASLLSGAITPWAKRIVALEARLDALPTPVPDPPDSPLSKFVAEPMTARIAALERRIAHAEQGGLYYRGIWQPMHPYEAGDVCTHNGSMWVAREHCDPGERPNDPDSGWQLAVKEGRPGKHTIDKGDGHAKRKR